MAEHRVLLIETPSFLSINLGRLQVDSERKKRTHILPEDIDVLCLNHPAIGLTSGVLRTLAESGAIVITTDTRHLPCGIFQPIGKHRRESFRLRQQITFENTDQAAELWRQIVVGRIITQAATLRYFGLRGALYLERLARKVQPGDPSNHEGQASKHYWKHLFEEGYTRQKQGATDTINSRLNFGYAVLRSLVARQIVLLGLNPNLGLGHHSTENSFNLADDFLEPFRFVVEKQVKILHSETPNLEPLNALGKKELLRFLSDAVDTCNGTFRLSTAIEVALESFCQNLAGAKINLILPNGNNGR